MEYLVIFKAAEHVGKLSINTSSTQGAALEMTWSHAIQGL